MTKLLLKKSYTPGDLKKITRNARSERFPIANEGDVIYFIDSHFIKWMDSDRRFKVDIQKRISRNMFSKSREFLSETDHLYFSKAFGKKFTVEYSSYSSREKRERNLDHNVCIKISTSKKVFSDSLYDAIINDFFKNYKIT